MIRMLGKRLLISVALLASPALAQDDGQTPENAHAFLAKVFSAGNVQVTSRQTRTNDFGVGITWTNGEHRWYFPWNPAVAWKYKTGSDELLCNSEVIVQGPYGHRIDRGTYWIGIINPLWGYFNSGRVIEASDPEYTNPNLRGSGALIWKSITSVDVQDATVTVYTIYNSGAIRFNFQTAALAKRAGFAMEVIRLGCDPTADANF